MMYLFLLGGLFLGWSFGRNNLSSAFGAAIGTRMLPFRIGAILAGIFILSGALFSSGATTTTIMELATIPSALGAFCISFSIAITISVAGRFGIPVSIVQSSVGAMIGWNVFFHISNKWGLLSQVIAAWFYCPLVSALFAIAGFYMMRWLLKTVKIPLLYRDFFMRILLVLGGLYTAYFLGANNMPAIAAPYLGVPVFDPFIVILLISLSIVVGILMADEGVIKTVSRGLYPLSPMEALIVVFSCGLTLYCFSGKGVVSLLSMLDLPTFPLVPIPTSSVLVGSIIGVGFAKGSAGIHLNALLRIIASWIIIPIISGLICWIILAILATKGVFL